MKKYFLTFITCTVFLSPSSGFCMEKEDDQEHPLYSTLRQLPREERLIIIETLGRIEEIAKIKQLSTFFYEFVEDTTNKILVNIRFFNEIYPS